MNHKGNMQNPIRHRMHPSLIRMPLYAGVDKGFLLVEACTIGFLFFAAGFHLSTVLAAATWMLVLHPLMVWIHARDPLLAALYIRSLSGKDYYVPHARRGGKAPAPKPSIPRK